MIWHLFEVWLMVVLVFVVGCLIGAHLYGLIAESRLSLAQGALADAVGDGLDRLKARIGLAPAWRPDHLRQVERVAAADVGSSRAAEPEVAPPASRDSPAPAEARQPPAPRSRRAVSPPSSRRAIAPPPITPPEPEPDHEEPAIVPMRPAGLAAPRGGVPDNLQRIKGIGKRNEELLNGLGIFHFGQIAAWTPGEAQWIGQYLAFPERIGHDDWVGQAMLLAMGTETGFQKSAERRRERRRRERDFQARLATAGSAYDQLHAENTAEGDSGTPEASGDDSVPGSPEPERAESDAAPENQDEAARSR
jgi:predicted flap endonuclease-1-like 5' DNA nuclease